jgi:hypothetical protein
LRRVILGIGSALSLDFGLWTLDFGLWTLDFGRLKPIKRGCVGDGNQVA